MYIIDCCFQEECRNIVTVKKIIGKILAKTWLQTFATKDIELIWKWSATSNRQPVTEYKTSKKENLNKKKFETVSSRQLILKNASQ